MKFIASGKKGQPVILLIHGMGCTGEHSFSSAARQLEGNYRVVIVCLDGYDEPNTTFTTIYEQAEKIASYITNECEGSIHTILGMSMGGIIALELLTKYDIKIKKLILDSGYLKPWNKICAKIMSVMVASGFDSIIKGNDRLIYRAGMNYTMGYCFKSTDLCEFASKETLKKSEYSCLTYNLPDLEILKRITVEYWHGKKERYMIAGMKFLKEKIPNMKEICVGNYGHGELMLNQPLRYAEMVLNSIKSPLVEGNC